MSDISEERTERMVKAIATKTLPNVHNNNNNRGSSVIMNEIREEEARDLEMADDEEAAQVHRHRRSSSSNMLNHHQMSREAREMEMAEETIHVAMAKLPDTLTASYKEACRFAPELIKKESDPRWFLSFHQSDALAAARRLAKYWMKRKDVFQERVFLPINLTGNGALTLDDVKLLRTGYFVNLPRDEKGRSILYVDPSKKPVEISPPLRVTFFIGQSIMENYESSQQHGSQFLFNVSNPFVDSVQMPNVLLAKLLVDECMPILFLRFHVIYVPPPGTKVDQAFINTNYTQRVNQLGRIFGDSVFVHITSSKEDCRAKLMRYDLSPEGLPVSFGGSWAQGCEPWRKGRRRRLDCNDDDELSLEIELDLSCLLRTTCGPTDKQPPTR